MTIEIPVETNRELADLVERTVAGEAVVLTMHGRPVAELRQTSAPEAARKVAQADLDWLAQVRIVPQTAVDSAEEVSWMRDQEWAGASISTQASSRRFLSKTSTPIKRRLSSLTVCS